MIRFEVRRQNAWIPVDRGTILPSGALMHFTGKVRDYSAIGHWRLSQATLDDPAFKQACRDKLSREEKELAKLRDYRAQFEPAA